MNKSKSSRNPARSFLDDYRMHRAKVDSFAQALKHLVGSLTAKFSHDIHSINARVKTEESLEKKITSKGKYNNLSDIHDIIGIRIILYFESDINKIASIIASEFEIDRINSIDKRERDDPAQFGYMSLHYIVALSENRLALPEYEAYRSMKAEIQIRSIIQHAWAEIEHDLGYKSELDIPKKIRHDFHRLAALLEQADEGFSKIREAVTNYEAAVSEQIGSPSEDFKGLEIDKSTLPIYMTSIRLVSKIDNKIANELGLPVVTLHRDDAASAQSSMYDWVITRRIEQFSLVGITKLADLHAELSRHENEVVTVASKILALPDPFGLEVEVQQGCCLFYLCYVVAAMRGRQSLLKYIKEGKFSEPPSTHEKFASDVLRFLKKKNTRKSKY